MRKELQNKLKGLQVSVVYLFGSAAIGRRTRSSDIDIGVVFKELPPGEDTRALYNTLYRIFSEVYRASKIDIVFLQKAAVSLQYSALKEGKVLFEEDPSFTADYEQRVINQYLDFKPVLEFFRPGCCGKIFKSMIFDQEIYNIIREELQDFYAFCSYINEILRAPERFGLAAE